MTQDYAKPKARKTSRKTRKNVRKKAPRTVPPWLWLATGVCAGLLVSFLFHLGTLPQDPASARDGDNGDSTAAEQEDGVEFNFYTLLPQREVLVSSERQPSRAKPKPSNTDSKSPAKTPEPGYHYYLQAGSFQHREEAEKRRIQLILLDMEANIEKVKHQGKSWYRVQSGPYLSTAQLATVQGKLSGEGIDTLVTKRKQD